MTDAFRQLLHEIEHGDLRPQFNPSSPLRWPPPQLKAVPPEDIVLAQDLLLARLFQLSRPIADPRTDPDSRLQDAGHFFYLVETLQWLGCRRLDETLLILLDDFAQLDHRSYDELYLWSIVQLSRTDPEHVRRFWPMVIDLDLRHRSDPWQRPPGVSLVEQPYRLTDLVFYFYVLYTLDRPRRRSLGAHLLRLAPDLSSEAHSLVRRSLTELSRTAPRPVYGDALGLLRNGIKSPP